MNAEEMIERWRYGLCQRHVVPEKCGLSNMECAAELQAALKSAREEGRREGIASVVAVCMAEAESHRANDDPARMDAARWCARKGGALAAKEEKHGS